MADKHDQIATDVNQSVLNQEPYNSWSNKSDCYSAATQNSCPLREIAWEIHDPAPKIIF